jgi:hypothetical protein
MVLRLRDLGFNSPGMKAELSDAAGNAKNFGIGVVGCERIPLFNPRIGVHELRPGKRA